MMNMKSYQMYIPCPTYIVSRCHCKKTVGMGTIDHRLLIADLSSQHLIPIIQDVSPLSALAVLSPSADTQEKQTTCATYSKKEKNSTTSKE